MSAGPEDRTIPPRPPEEAAPRRPSDAGPDDFDRRPTDAAAASPRSAVLPPDESVMADRRWWIFALVAIALALGLIVVIGL